jgi:hypothetical protein
MLNDEIKKIYSKLKKIKQKKIEWPSNMKAEEMMRWNWKRKQIQKLSEIKKIKRIMTISYR